MPAIPILRRLSLAAALALPASLAAQTEVHVMPFAGVLPFVSIQGGAHVQVSPGVGDWSVFAEYERSAWGMTCESAVLDVRTDDDRCGEEGNSIHAGVARHLAGREVRWRPYVALGAGYAKPVGPNATSSSLSLLGEGGVDVGGTRWLSLRLGARWQGRPTVGTDFVGPVLGVRLRL